MNPSTAKVLTWIPPDWHTIVATGAMAQKCYKYWEISHAWNQRPGASSINASQAMDCLNALLETLGPQRSLCKYVDDVMWGIILGRAEYYKRRRAPNE